MIVWRDFYGDRDVVTNREKLQEECTSANIALNDNVGQILKLGVKLFKSRPSKKGHSNKFAPFCMALVKFVY